MRKTPELAGVRSGTTSWRRNASLLAACAIPLWLFPAVTAPVDGLELVADGESAHTIHHADDAPSSVATAARELRLYLKRAADADLPMGATSVAPMICLGQNEAARAAGLSAADIPVEGWRIAVRGGNLYVLGVDTPDGRTTPGGGFSTGTLNGVYTLIHDVLGVRWLMPGPYGDDVPKTAKVVVAEEDLTGAPVFRRRILNLGSGPVRLTHAAATTRWLARQRLGASVCLSHGHAWRRTIPARLFEDHPEYFAMTAGVRIDPVNGPPKDWFADKPALAHNLLEMAKIGRYKLCTANPGLVRTYAAAVASAFGDEPGAKVYSLSPSDGGRFCECAACAALHEKGPNGELSVTPAILKFYNGVAELVGARFPDSRLAGYVYASYQHPPADKSWRPHPNLVLVAAPSKLTYGVGLMRPGKIEAFESLIRDWGALSSNMAYYDMCGVLEQFHAKSMALGAPNPPSLEILKRVFAEVKRCCRHGVHFTGVSAWGQAGLLNYLLANLIRDPDADVDGLFHEYCDRAYGRGGAYMKELYRTVDRAMTVHCRTHANARYVLTESMLRDVYAATYDQIEWLFLKARDAAETPAQKHRLRMVRDNLVFLNWSLRRRGMIEDDPNSPLRLSDKALGQLYESEESELALYPMRATWAQLRERIPKALAPPPDCVRFPKYVHFQPDPENAGVAQGWFEAGFDASRWRRISVEDTWEDQGYGPPAYPGKGGYNGYAWYRAEQLRVAAKYRTLQAFIHFGAVDESCWVYVNGKLAASFEYDPVANPDSWEQPLQLPLGDALHYGKPNTIAVRVHDSGGAGGIWRGAFLLFRPRK